MDETDRTLLRLLRANGRESFTALAKDLGTSEGTIRARVKRLLDDGIIRRFTIRTAGRNVKSLIEVSVAQHVQIGTLTKTIASWDGVEAVWEVTGDDDIVVVADCHDPGRLNDIIDAIRELPGIEATRSRLILKEQ
jgi:DNA-binding Lrp family transcriptional regulator